MDELDPVDIRNEFAAARVHVTVSAAGARLAIEDLRTGLTIHLDALELEALAHSSHDELAPLIDPARRHTSTPLASQELS